MKKHKLNYRLIVFSFCLLMNGCATTNCIPPTNSYHRIEKGETLWRIAKIYNVDLDRLATINGIIDTGKVKTGQLILIPKEKTELNREVNFKNFEEFIWPIKGKIISRYGDITDNLVNKGLDIQAKFGQEVHASRSGMVSFCDEELKGYGKTIIIDHGDGFFTVYARNSENLVNIGERVYRGMVIGKIGNIAKISSSYLHFEIRKGHIPQNPSYYLP